MSEKLHHSSPEHRQAHAERERGKEAEHLKQLQEKAKKSEKEPKSSIETIKKSIETAAVSGKEYSVGEKESTKQSSPNYGINKELKASAYKRTLKKARSQLSAPEKTFSRVVHNPIVEKTSDLAAKTVARPSGILIGGIGAFLGTLAILYISKRSGFTYNYLLFLLIFVAFYVLGVTLELVTKATRRFRR